MNLITPDDDGTDNAQQMGRLVVLRPLDESDPAESEAIAAENALALEILSEVQSEERLVNHLEENAWMGVPEQRRVLHFRWIT